MTVLMRRASRISCLAALMIAVVASFGVQADNSTPGERAAGVNRQQSLLGLAELARQQGKAEQAGQYLASMDDGYWAAVGYMNLAAYYAREDLTPSRALVSLRVAMAMAEKDTDTARRRNLLDQLNLRAGSLALNNHEYDKAIAFFEKVTLESYHSPQALYLHGLALSGKGNHRAAMQSWHRAKKFPLAFPGVAAAWIGMGRGYDLAGYPGQAGESWLAANVACKGERATLAKLAEGIREQGAYKTLVEDARGDQAQWFLADSRTLSQPRMAYLLRFLEQPDAQNGVRRVARLDEMAATLASNLHDLTVFVGALENHTGAIAGPEISVLEIRHSSLADHLQQLQAQTTSPEQLQALRQVERLLASGSERLSALQQRSTTQPERLARALDEARSLHEHTQTLQAKVWPLRSRASDELDRLALDFVAAEDQRMIHAVDKTEQQIAHLYEYLALENLSPESSGEERR